MVLLKLSVAFILVAAAIAPIQVVALPVSVTDVTAADVKTRDPPQPGPPKRTKSLDSAPIVALPTASENNFLRWHSKSHSAPDGTVEVQKLAKPTKSDIDHLPTIKSTVGFTSPASGPKPKDSNSNTKDTKHQRQPIPSSFLAGSSSSSGHLSPADKRDSSVRLSSSSMPNIPSIPGTVYENYRPAKHESAPNSQASTSSSELRAADPVHPDHAALAPAAPVRPDHAAAPVRPDHAAAPVPVHHDHAAAPVPVAPKPGIRATVKKAIKSTVRYVKKAVEHCHGGMSMFGRHCGTALGV